MVSDKGYIVVFNKSDNANIIIGVMCGGES